MKKHLVCGVVTIVLIAGAFYGGTWYAGRKTNNQRGQRMQEFAVPGRGRAMMRNSGNRGDGLVQGEVIAKDDKSITIKARDGGSRIVLIAGSTEITKQTQGGLSDIVIGQRVLASGDQNPDGSITAKTAQLLPAIVTP